MKRARWMILAAGIKERKLLTHYYPMVTFAIEIGEDDAKKVAQFMRDSWPRYRWIATNRQDWNRCYNTAPEAKQ